jgi:hypothetical protein
VTMGVHVNSFDPFSSDHDWEFLAYRLLSVGISEETAAAEDDAGGDGSHTSFQKITACGHDNFLHRTSLLSRSVIAMPRKAHAFHDCRFAAAFKAQKDVRLLNGTSPDQAAQTLFAEKIPRKFAGAHYSDDAKAQKKT